MPFLRSLLLATACTVLFTAGPAMADAARDKRDCQKLHASSDYKDGPWLAHFDTGKTELKAEGRKSLSEAADLAKARYIQHICAVGRADQRGNKEFNERLALRRAETVKRYLQAQGVDARITAVTAGEAFGDTLFGKVVSEEDRRVEVFFLE